MSAEQKQVYVNVRFTITGKDPVSKKEALVTQYDWRTSVSRASKGAIRSDADVMRIAWEGAAAKFGVNPADATIERIKLGIAPARRFVKLANTVTVCIEQLNSEFGDAQCALCGGHSGHHALCANATPDGSKVAVTDY